MAKTRSDSDDVMKFEIKRSHFWALLAPLTFVLGLAVGFLLWGRGAAAAPVASGSGNGSLPQAAAGEAGDDITSQLANLPRYDITIEDDDPVLGDPDAPITIVEFGDFQCPFCVQHFQQTYPELTARYGDQIRFVFKHFPLASLHPDAFSASEASECANEQGKFWEYHDLLFGGTQGLGRAAYIAYAEEINLDVDEFSACLDEERYSDSVLADYSYGSTIGVNSTPTFFVNGIAMIGSRPISEFVTVIDYELENQQ